MANRIYTIGYAGWKFDDFKRLVERYDAVVLDIRYNPTSRMAEWRRVELSKCFGWCYLWVKGLGNENFARDCPVKIHDFEAGLKLVTQQLTLGNVILLCGCRDLATCHRKEVAERIAERFTVEVVHLSPDGMGDLFGG
jgi:uncharacterized protein (DUF488 family)